MNVLTLCLHETDSECSYCILYKFLVIQHTLQMSIWRIWKDADNSSDEFRQHSRNACLSIEPPDNFWKSQEASAEVKRLKGLGRALVKILLILTWSNMDHASQKRYSLIFEMPFRRLHTCDNFFKQKIIQFLFQK